MTSNQRTGRIVAELRSGALGVTLWANETKRGEQISVTLRRSYRREQGGPWEETKMTLHRQDLLEAAELLRHMFWKASEHQAGEQQLPEGNAHDEC